VALSPITPKPAVPPILENPKTGKQGVNPLSIEPPLPWYASKVTWVGILGAVAGLAGLVGVNVPSEEANKLAQGIATAAPALMSVIGVLTVLFRRTATKPIAGSSADPTKKKTV
jgi:uncharacterized membrane protein